MEPFYKEPMATIYCGDALRVLKELPDESIPMAMTSPPYWGLRNYAGGTDIIWSSSNGCEHEWIESTQGLQHENRNNLVGTQEEVRDKTGTAFIQKYDRLPAGFCSLCVYRVFYEAETGKLALPASFILNAVVRRQLPHLNDLVGESDSTSPLKEKFIEALRARGYIWIEECEQCKKDGTLKRKLEREKYLAVREAERIVGYS
ncbi:hypothetical protein ES703_84411 [subsurface metagenome]